MRFSKYYNNMGGHKRIYSFEDLERMSLGEALDKELELGYQNDTIGLPDEDELMNSLYVQSVPDEQGINTWQSLAEPRTPTPMSTIAPVWKSHVLQDPLSDAIRFEYPQDDDLLELEQEDDNSDDLMSTIPDAALNTSDSNPLDPETEYEDPSPYVLQGGVSKSTIGGRLKNFMHDHFKKNNKEEDLLSEENDEIMETDTQNPLETTQNVIPSNPIEKKRQLYDSMNDVAMIDSWTLPTLISGGLGAAKVAPYVPYTKDIVKGRNLIFHKPFEKMSREEFREFKRLGEEYYKEYLQKNPVDIKKYGKVSFSRHNRGKDDTFNYEQYPFLRKQLKEAHKTKTTNSKNEWDRIYDHFSNDFRGDEYDYIIENLIDIGKRYKMMRNMRTGK